MKRPHVDTIAPERPAICMRDLGGFHMVCAEDMQLVVTRSPLGQLPYEELIVLRCAAGHVERGDGVLTDAPIDDGRADNWGAF